MPVLRFREWLRNMRRDRQDARGYARIARKKKKLALLAICLASWRSLLVIDRLAHSRALSGEVLFA
jgi:hypothetical protein